MRNCLFGYRTHSLLLTCFIALVGCGGNDASTDMSLGPDPDSGLRSPLAATVPLFDESKILDFKLTFAPEEWTKFQQIHSNPPPPSERNTYTKVYVHCGFEALGVKFADAACRPKGNPESWKDEKKPQFAIKFDHWDDKGRFLTLRRLNLESNPAADAPVRDRLGMWAMREAGLKASRVNHVRVYKDGVLLGLYMNIEEVDKEFIQWQFVKPDGNLYSQGRYLETNTHKMPDTSRLDALDDLVDGEPLSGDHAKFFDAYAKLVNVPVLLAMTAGEVMLPTGDNWSNGGTNYFFYDSPASGKFYLLPWDLDTILNMDFAPANADPYAFWGKPVLGLAPNKVLQLLYQKPEWKKEFEDDLVKMRDTVLRRLPAQAGQVCAQIRDDFSKDPSKYVSLEDFDADCARIQKHITDRIAYLHTVLNR